MWVGDNTTYSPSKNLAGLQTNLRIVANPNNFDNKPVVIVFLKHQIRDFETKLRLKISKYIERHVVR